MKFYIVIRKKPRNGFRHPKWKPYDQYIYLKFSEARIIRDVAKSTYPKDYFHILDFMGDGPKLWEPTR